MAIVISDTNDKRKVGKVNYDVVNLAPTIGARAGSKTQVQDTAPLRKEAEKFMYNMNRAGLLYTEAVDMVQDGQQKAVAEMDQAEFDTLVAAGGTKEMNNLFGQSKAFHESVAKRQYATEVPNMLASLETELHKDITQYEDIEDFQSKSNAKFDEAFKQMDAGFSNNIFTQKANNALKAVTKSKFLANQNKKYNQEIIQFNNDEANRQAYSAFSEINLPNIHADNIDVTFKNLENTLSPTITNKAERKKIITGAYMSAINSAWNENNWSRVEMLIEAIEGDINFTAGSSGNIKGDEYKVNNIPFFGDPDNQQLITQYVGKLEQAKMEHNELMVKTQGKTILSDINLTMNQIFETEGEEALASWIDDTLENIAKGSVTLNQQTDSSGNVTDEGQVYDNREVLSLAVDYLKSQDAKYYEGTKNLQYQSRTEQPSKLLKDSLFKDENTFKALLSTTDLDSNHYFKVIAKGLETEESDEVAPWLAEMTAEMDTWYNQTYQDYIRDNDINAGNYTEKLGEDFHSTFQEQIKSKALELLNKYTPKDLVKEASFEQEAIDAGINVDTYSKLKSNYKEDPDTFKKIITEMKRNKQDTENGEGSYDLTYNDNGTVSPDIKGYWYETREESFIDAYVDGQFKDQPNLLLREQYILKQKGHNILRKNLSNWGKAAGVEAVKLTEDINKQLNIVGLAVVDFTGTYAPDRNRRNDVVRYLTSSSNGGYTHHDGFNTFGLRLIPERGYLNTDPTERWSTDVYTEFETNVAVTGKDASYTGTLEAIRKFQQDGTINIQMQKAADVLNMRVEDLYSAQIQFFTEGGYITEPTQQSEE